MANPQVQQCFQNLCLQKKQMLQCLRNGQCLHVACVHPIRDPRGKLGEHKGSVRDAQGMQGHL